MVKTLENAGSTKAFCIYWHLLFLFVLTRYCCFGKDSTPPLTPLGSGGGGGGGWFVLFSSLILLPQKNLLYSSLKVAQAVVVAPVSLMFCRHQSFFLFSSNKSRPRNFNAFLYLSCWWRLRWRWRGCLGSDRMIVL